MGLPGPGIATITSRVARKLGKNDRFAAVGAALSMALFALGSEWVMGAVAWRSGTWIGLGVLGYGIVYTLVHDGLVHHRWFRWVPNGGYAGRLVQAHNLHHATIGKQGGVSFGFVAARGGRCSGASLRRKPGPVASSFARQTGNGSRRATSAGKECTYPRNGPFSSPNWGVDCGYA